MYKYKLLILLVEQSSMKSSIVLRKKLTNLSIYIFIPWYNRLKPNPCAHGITGLNPIRVSKFMGPQQSFVNDHR